MTQMNGTVRPIEPLEPSLWFERFLAAEARVREAEGPAPDQLLRQVYHLTQLTPAPLAHLLGARICEATFEQLLEREQYDGAALLLLGAGVDFAIARSDGGETVTATVSIGGRQPASTAACKTLSRAVLTAYCACVASLSDRTAPERGATGQARQTGRSAPHRLSLPH